jgi:hypothetical protein
LNAYEYVSTELDWSIEIVSRNPLLLRLTGSDRFAHYLAGGADSKFKSRARTAIVQAVAGVVHRLSEGIVRLKVRVRNGRPIEPSDDAKIIAESRAYALRQVRAAITAADYNALLDLSIVRPPSDDGRSGDADGAHPPSDPKPVVKNEIDELLEGIEPIRPLTPPWVTNLDRDMSLRDAVDLITWLECSDDALVTAVKYVFSDGMAWRVRLRDGPGFRLAVTGDKRFEDYAGNRKLTTERDRAWTAAVRTLLARIEKMDQAEFLALAGLHSLPDMLDAREWASIADRFKMGLRLEFLSAANAGGATALSELIDAPGFDASRHAAFGGR